MSPTPARRAGGTAARIAKIAAPIVLAFAAGMVAEGRRAEATPTEASPYAVTGELARVLVVMERSYVDPVDRDKAPVSYTHLTLPTNREV